MIFEAGVSSQSQESSGVRVLARSRSLLKETPTPGLSVSSGLLCNFVAVCFTFVHFILLLKLPLHTVVHLLLEEFKISLKSFQGTISMSHSESWSWC